MDALSLIFAVWLGGTALQGRVFPSLGFQPQAGEGIANPNEVAKIKRPDGMVTVGDSDGTVPIVSPDRMGAAPPDLGLKPQVIQSPPLQGDPPPNTPPAQSFGDTLVVTAARSRERLTDAVAPTSVLTREDI